MNQHKDGPGWPRNPDGSRNGWKGCSLDFLIGKPHEETGELIAAIKNQEGTEAIRNEEAVVGNIAMMLADISNALSYIEVPEPTDRPPLQRPECT